MGEGEAARRSRSFCKRRAARGHGAGSHWYAGVFCTLTRAARGLLKKPATRVPPDLSRNKAGAGEVPELRPQLTYAKVSSRKGAS